MIWREGELAGAPAPARKCLSLINIFNFNKNKEMPLSYKYF